MEPTSPITLTDVLSAIGAFSGLSSLSWNAYKYWCETPRIKLNLPDPDSNISFKASVDDGYIHPGRCIVYIEIGNESSLPISITKFQLCPYDKPSIHYTYSIFVKPSESYDVLQITQEHGVGVYSFPIGFNLLSLPCTLNPYEVKIGSLFFLMDEPRKFTAKLTASTLRKTFSTDVKINLPKRFSLMQVKSKNVP